MKRENVRGILALGVAAVALGTAAATHADDVPGKASWSLISAKSAADLTTGSDRVLHVTVHKPSAKYYDTQLTHDIAAPIPAGHVLTYRFEARSGTNNPVHVVIEKRKAPYTHYLDKMVALTPSWKPYRFVLPIPAAHLAGELAARLQVAQQAGTLEFRNIAVTEAAK